MIKRCPVIMSNKYVTVVRFDDKLVQLPTTNKDEKFLMVAFENGKYFISDVNDHFDDAITKKNVAKSRGIKKTTNNEIKETEHSVSNILDRDIEVC